jgi:two-component system, LytTR family, response regulator
VTWGLLHWNCEPASQIRLHAIVLRLRFIRALLRMRGEQPLRSVPEIFGVDALASVHVHVEPIRVFVVEPEAGSRRLICSLVEGEPGMTVECVDDSRLVSSVQEHAPDLVILDANTPLIRRGASWDALGIEAPPATIVTAYDPAALVAFASIAVDTVVKPFNVERFETALDLAKSRIFRARTERQVADGWVPEESGISRRQFVQRLAVEEDEKFVLIRIDDVQWIQSLGKHIRLYTEEKSHLLRQSMKNLQAKLDPKRFLRVHRNAIVNLDHVDEFHLPPSGDMLVKLRNGVSLPLRRGTRNMLRKFLKQIS